ncbi:P-II family nitrogen regulator [Desulfovibrio sp. OttesenSCG-928-G15]|nr:P-II family nitrogen regulator [Desulfovibrio sp. OttesenSCG-928-G15]
MTISFKPAKLFSCLVGRHKAELLVQAAKSAGARGGTICYGRSVGESKLLQALSLADVQQEMVFFLVSDEANSVIQAVAKAALENPKKLSGYASVIEVPRMMMRTAATPGIETQNQPKDNGSSQMNSGHQLVTVITNSGYADDIMAAARSAGATGGTILTARGTGTEEDVKFFGISLVPEKEMLLIVVDDTKVDTIVSAIQSVPKLNEPGGGIVYTTRVEQFFVLGKDTPLEY